MKKERATTSDEQRERMLISEQIERAKAEVRQKSESPENGEKPLVEEGLKREEGEKLVLSISLKPAVSSTASSDDSASTSGSTPSGGFKFNALKTPAANPLKRPNIFKMAAAAKANQNKEKDGEKTSMKRDSMSVAERLIHEDQERKKRKTERESERVAS